MTDLKNPKNGPHVEVSNHVTKEQPVCIYNDKCFYLNI